MSHFTQVMHPIVRPFVVLIIAAAMAGPALGGWLDGLLRAGKPARGAGSHGTTALEHATTHLHSIPVRADRTGIVGAASHEGHWRFVNRSGETMTAATPEELVRALTVLAPEAARDGPRLAVYLTEDTVFQHRTLLKDLPGATELHVVVGREAYPLIRTGEGATARHYAEVRPRVVVETTERSLFDEAVWQIARPLNRANVRVIALEPGGPAHLSSAPKIEPGTRRALTDAIDPDRLRHSLSSIRGQTALVTGRVEGELLFFKPASGPERSLILKDLISAAEAGDVNLIVLRSSSPRQPGARNWLWQKVEVENLEQAIGRQTIADFLNALRGDQGRMIVTASPRGALRVDLEMRPAAGLPGEAATNPISATFNEIMAEVTAKVVIHGASASMRHSERQQELDRRLIPGLPADLVNYVIGAIVMGCIAMSVSLRWWQRIWPREVRAEYAGGIGYRAAQMARWLAFIAVFLPIAGPFSFLVAICTGLADMIMRPVRWLSGLSGRRTSTHS